MVGVEIWTYLGVNATWALAFPACGKVVSTHAVHIGRRTAEVA